MSAGSALESLMSHHRTTVPRYSPREWAILKLRNGYRLSLAEKFLLGAK